jgi:hypothetical protein
MQCIHIEHNHRHHFCCLTVQSPTTAGRVRDQHTEREAERRLRARDIVLHAPQVRIRLRTCSTFFVNFSNEKHRMHISDQTN